MRRKWFLLLSSLILLAWPAASAVAAGRSITITGSTTVLPIAQKAAEEYMKRHPQVRISVAGTGSGDGIRSLIEGTCDIADASRDLKPKEKALLKAKGIRLVKHVVALDCIVAVVHPSNPVDDLSLAQLRDIYTGRVRDWKQVGGRPGPVVAISRDSSSGTFEVWNHKVLQGARVRPDAQLQASNGAVAQAVAGNRYAIGYLGLGYLNPRLKALTIGGVRPGPATAVDGSYPVARPLFMFTRGEPTGAVKDFLDFVKGPEGRRIAREEGFVPMP